MFKKTFVILLCGILISLFSGTAFAALDKVEAPTGGEDFDHAVSIEEGNYYFLEGDFPESKYETNYAWYSFVAKESGEYAFYGKGIKTYNYHVSLRVYDKYEDQIAGSSDWNSEMRYNVELQAGYKYYVLYTVSNYSIAQEQLKADLAICSPSHHALPGTPGEKCEVCGRVIEETTTFQFQPVATQAPAPKVPAMATDYFDGINVMMQSTHYGDFIASNANYKNVWETIWVYLPAREGDMALESVSWTNDVCDYSLGDIPDPSEAAFEHKSITTYTCGTQENTAEQGVTSNAWIGLPDDPSIAGDQTIVLTGMGWQAKLSIHLDYLGSYESGEGWSIYVTDITTSKLK